MGTKKIGLEAVFDDREFNARITRYMASIDKAVKKHNDFSKATQSSNKALSGVDVMVGNLRQSMEANLAEMDKQEQAIQRQSASLDEWAKGLQTVGIALAAVGAAGTALIGSSVMLAARTETLGVVTAQLGKNAGKTEEEIRGLEQAIVSQGITLRRAREGLALMAQAQIDLARGADLARVAQDAAVIANVDSSEAFQRLVYTISSGNIRMARTLGLQVNFQRSYERLAESIGVTTDELTEQQKVQARTNEVMRAGSTIVGTYDAAMTTAGKKVLSLNRHIEESRRILGEAFLPVFADLIDATTSLLEKWEYLDEGTQAVISTALGAATAFAVLAGAGFLVASSLLKIAANAAIAGVALGGVMGPLTILTTLIGGSIVLVAAATEAQKQQTKALRELEQQALDTAKSYEDYISILQKGAKEEKKAIKTREEINKITEENLYINQLYGLDPIDTYIIAESEAHVKNAIALREEQEFREDVHKGIMDARDAQQEYAKQEAQNIISTRTLSYATDEQREAYQKLLTKLEDVGPTQQVIREFEKLKKEMDIGKEAAKIEEDARRLQQALQQQFSDLRQVVDFELTKSFEDFKEELVRVGEEEKNIEKRIADVTDKISDYHKEIQKIKDEEGPLTEEQKERISEYNERIGEANVTLGELREELGLIPGKLDEVRAAWDLQTKQMIFDLTAQRLAMDGLTTEELTALGRLAGPEGFGLIDEAGARMLSAIGLAADELDKAGDQTDTFMGILVDLQGRVGDTERSIEDLGASIDDLPTEKEIKIIFRAGEIPELGGKRLFEYEGALPSFRQSGGKLSGFDVLGDRGPEMVIGNQIIPADQTSRFLKSLSGIMDIPASMFSAKRSTFTPPPAYNTNTTSTTYGDSSYNLHIHTSARTEPIIADFRTMKALGSRI